MSLKMSAVDISNLWGEAAPCRPGAASLQQAQTASLDLRASPCDTAPASRPAVRRAPRSPPSDPANTESPHANLVELPERCVLIPYQLVPATSALAATFAWGMSDFVGGYASRRANAYLLTTITHLSGTAVMLVLALLFHSPFPARENLQWAVAAGLFGGFALAVFYRAL